MDGGWGSLGSRNVHMEAVLQETGGHAASRGGFPRLEDLLAPVEGAIFFGFLRKDADAWVRRLRGLPGIGRQLEVRQAGWE